MRELSAMIVAMAGWSFVLPALFGPGRADAAPCVFVKLAAAGQEVAARLRCEARDLDTGVVPACVATAATRRQLAFAAAEAEGGCQTTGDSAAIGDAVDDLVASLRTALLPGGPGSSLCTEGQLRAAARAARRLMQAYARNARQPDAARLNQRIADAQELFTAPFTDAVALGSCLSATGDVAAFTMLGQGAARLRGLLEPSCGDGVRAPVEPCDGDDLGSCPGTCTASCTCDMSAVCPCWTRTVIDATFPPGYFDQNGRGGATCDSPTGIRGVVSSDTCFFPRLVNPGFDITRAGAVILEGSSCALFADLDIGNDGSCDVPPLLTSISAAQESACIAELEASEVYQTECVDPPPTSCPCWTTASLNATFPPGYFDAAGRGGVRCEDSANVSSVGSVDTCRLPQPGGPGFDLPRAGAAVVGGSYCSLITELDPGDDGSCDLPPSIVGIDADEAAACKAALQASQQYLSECS